MAGYETLNEILGKGTVPVTRPRTKPKLKKSVYNQTKNAIKQAAPAIAKDAAEQAAAPPKAPPTPAAIATGGQVPAAALAALLGQKKVDELRAGATRNREMGAAIEDTSGLANAGGLYVGDSGASQNKMLASVLGSFGDYRANSLEEEQTTSKQAAINEILGTTSQTAGPSPAQLVGLSQLGVDDATMRMMFPDKLGGGGGGESSAVQNIKEIDRYNQLAQEAAANGDEAGAARYKDLASQLQTAVRNQSLVSTIGGTMVWNPMTQQMERVGPASIDADPYGKGQIKKAEAEQELYGAEIANKVVGASGAQGAIGIAKDLRENVIPKVPSGLLSGGWNMVRSAVDMQDPEVGAAMGKFDQLAGQLTLAAPHLPGPASDLDAQLMRQSVGVMNDITKTMTERMSAAQAAADAATRLYAKWGGAVQGAGLGGVAPTTAPATGGGDRRAQLQAELEAARAAGR